VATQVFSAASNVNGAYVEYVGLSAVKSAAGGTNIALIAKSTAPASANDGDVIFRASSGLGNSSATNHYEVVTIQQVQRIKIAAGKGLFINQTSIGGSPASQFEKTILYTLL
jgi:hypothetical protein